MSRPVSHGGPSPIEQRVAWQLFLVLALLSIIGVVATLVVDDEGTVTAAGAPGTIDTSVQGTVEEPETLTLAVTGDIIIHESVAQQAEANADDGFDFVPMFRHVAPILTGADLAICHLETPLSADNTDLAYFPAFRVPFETADAISAAGYDGCSVASNHSLDAGRVGVGSTLQHLQRADLTATGMALDAEQAAQPAWYEIGDGLRIAHLSFTYGLNTGPLDPSEAYLANVLDEAEMFASASRARAAGADLVILSVHWGTEYQASPDEQQGSLAPRLLRSADIDLLVGHHAHVVQPIQEIDGEFVLYGLGNFLSNQSPESCSVCPATTQDGAIGLLTIEQSASGPRFSAVDVIPTYVDRTTYEIVPIGLDVPVVTSVPPSTLDESQRRTLEVANLNGVLD